MATTQTPNATTSQPKSASKQPAPARSSAYSPPASPLGRVPAPPGLARPGQPAGRNRRANGRGGTPWLTFSAFVLTMVWFGVVAFYVIKAGGFTSFLESSGAAAIIAVTGLMLAPAALFWMMFAYLKRASDVESALEPLLRQLSLITGSGGVAETRVRRFNDALQEQLSLLKETGVTATKTAQQALTTLTAERTELEQSQTGFATQIDGLVTTMRQHSSLLEALVDDGQDQMNRIAIGAREASAALAGETHNAENRLTSLLDNISGKFNATFVRLDKEQQEHLHSYATLSHDVSQTLKGDAGEIEGKLSTLLSAVTDTLDELERVAADRLAEANSASDQIAAREQSLRAEAISISNEIEESAAALADATSSFRENATAGRAEAERLLAALDQQTETLGSHVDTAHQRLDGSRTLITDAIAALETAASRLDTIGDTTSLSVESRIAALSDAATALDTTADKITSQLDGQLGRYGATQTEIESSYTQIVERLHSQSSALAHAAEKLGAEADNSVTRLRTAGETLARDAGAQFDRYTQAVTDAAGQLESQATTSAARIQTSVTTLSDATQASLDDYTSLFDRMGTQLGAQVTTAATRLRDAGTTIAADADQQFDRYRDTLTAAAGTFETQASASADRLRVVIGELSQTASQQFDNYSQGVTNAAAKLEAQTSASVERVESTIADLSGITGRQIEAYTAAASHAAEQLELHTSQSADRLRSTTEQVADAATQQFARYNETILANAAALEAQASSSADRVQAAIGLLSKTTSQSLESYSAIAGKADAQAAMVADNFNSAIDRYAGTARQLNVAAAELQQLAVRCDETIADMGSTLADRAATLEGVSERMAGTGSRVKDDAAALTVNLQQLTDRLETIRAAAAETSDQTVLRLTDIASVASRNLTGLDQLASATLGRLEEAGTTIARQQDAIGQQVDQIRSGLDSVSGDLSNRVATVLTDVEQASQTAGALIGGFIDRAREIAPALESTAASATESALAATATISAENQRFGDRLVSEKTRWQALIDEQGRAFAETLQELDTQLQQLGQVNVTMAGGAQAATERLLAHNTAVVDLDTRLTTSSRTQGEQLDNVRGEIEKLVDYLQRQALTLNTVTQGAVESVRTATESFGSEARNLGDVSRQTEAQIVSATERMGDAKAITATTREDVYALRTEIEQALEKLAAQTGQLEATRSLTNDVAAELTAQAGQATLQLGTLTGNLGDALERATMARASAFVQMDEVAGRVRGEVDTLEATIQQLHARAETILTAIGAAGNNAGQQIETQLEATLGALRIQLDTIANDVMTLATAAAESAGNAAVTLRAQVADQLAIVDAQAETVLAQIGARADISAAQISSAANQLATAGQQTETQFDRALAQIGATDAAVSQLTAHASGMRQQLIDDSETTISALDRITQELTGKLGLLRSTSELGLADAGRETSALQAMLDQATTQLSAGSRQLQDISASAGTYLAGLGSQLEAQVSLVRDTSQELALLSRETASGEGELTDRLGSLMGQINRARGDLATLDLQLAQQAAQLSAQQQETLSTLGQTLSTLEETGSRIVASNANTLGSLTAVETRYQSIASQAGAIAGTHAADLDQVASRTATTLSQLAETLQSTSRAQTQQLSEQQQQLATLYGTLRTESSASGEQLATLADRITAAGVVTGTAAQDIIGRLDTVAQSLIADFGSVTGAASEAATMLHGESDRLIQNSAQIGHTARTAASETGDAFAALRRHGTESQAALAAQLSDTLDTLAGAQQTYASLNEQMAQQNQTAETLLASVGDRFGGLLETAQRTMLQLRQEMEGFTASAATVLDQSGIDAYGRQFAQLVETLGTGTGQALDDLRNVTSSLQSAHDLTTETAHVTERSLLDAVASLESRQQQLALVAQQAATQVRQGGDAIDTTVRSLNEQVAGTTRQLLETVTSSVGEQSSTLARHAETTLIDFATAIEAQQQRYAETAEHTAQRLARIGTDTLTTATDTLSARHTELAETAEQTAARVTQAGVSVSRTLDLISERAATHGEQVLSQLAETLSRRQEQIFAEAEQRAESILAGFERFKTQLDTQVSGLTAQLADTGRYVERQATAFSALNDSQAELRHETEQTLQVLNRAAQNVSSTAATTQGSLDDMVQHLSSLGGTASSAIQSEIDELRQLTDSASSLINDLGRSLEVQVSAVTDAGSALAHVSGSVNDNTNVALSRLQTLNQRLEAAKLSATMATEQAASRVAEILAQVDSDDDFGTAAKAS